jgi:hypothetical protein
MDQPHGGLQSIIAPMAQHVQSQGRGEDTMLIHMTPNEVNSLQGLAMAHGGSLTINPHTGLVEAGWLGKLLPTLLGAALAATGVGAPLAAGIVGLGQTALTGSLKKGLMAGLGAFGGASLAGAAGLGGAISKTGFGALSSKAGLLGANMGLGAVAPAALTGAAAAPVSTLASSVAPSAPLSLAGAQAVPGAVVASGAPAGIGAVSGGLGAAAGAGAPATLTGATQAYGSTAANTGQFTGGLTSRFGQAASTGLPGGIVGKAAPYIAAQGLMQGVSGAMTPSGGAAGPDGRVDNSYQGPYYAQQRKPVFTGTTEDILAGNGGQQKYYDVDMPEIYNTMGQVVQPGSQTVRGTQIMQPVFRKQKIKRSIFGDKPITDDTMYDFMPTTYMGGVDPKKEEEQSYTGYAHGGEVQLSDGAFVLDARTVSEIGNGSSNAGMDALRRMGGHPVQGPGDGVSDSVPARIGRNQPARVARDEVIMPADVVRRIGKGNPQRGADKLYALMNKAHKARKQAGRGQDTKLRHGLG